MAMITMTCSCCHRDFEINANNEKVYDSPLIKENWVCLFCFPNVVMQKIHLKCTDCGAQFSTRILKHNLSKYEAWRCPQCVAPKLTSSQSKKLVDSKCNQCKIDSGVCCNPDVECEYNKGFAFFDPCMLSDHKESNTSVLLVTAVDRTRDDIHSFKYSPVTCKTMFSKDNFVVIKEKATKGETRVVVYTNVADVGLHKFSDKMYGKGENWIVGVREELTKDGFFE